MYIIKNSQVKYKLTNAETFRDIEGFAFGGRKTHKIAGEEITGLKIYNKKLAHPIVKKQVEKKYQKLITLLTELLVSDDSSGTTQMKALTEIEKFRQMIKNKYRDYLTRKDLEVMSKQLSIMQMTAKNKIIELQNALLENELSKGRSSSK